MMIVCVTGGACTTVVVAGGVAACCNGGVGSTVTLICSFDLRFPAFCAPARRRCTEFITSSGWARKASPRFFT